MEELTGLDKFFADLDELAEGVDDLGLFILNGTSANISRVHELRVSHGQEELVDMYHRGFLILDLLDPESEEFESLCDDIHAVYLAIHPANRP